MSRRLLVIASLLLISACSGTGNSADDVRDGATADVNPSDAEAVAADGAYGDDAGDATPADVTPLDAGLHDAGDGPDAHGDGDGGRMLGVSFGESGLIDGKNVVYRGDLVASWELVSLIVHTGPAPSVEFEATMKYSSGPIAVPPLTYLNSVGLSRVFAHCAFDDGSYVSVPVSSIFGSFADCANSDACTVKMSFQLDALGCPYGTVLDRYGAQFSWFRTFGDGAGAGAGFGFQWSQSADPVTCLADQLCSGTGSFLVYDMLAETQARPLDDYGDTFDYVAFAKPK